jgi:hypothetical protein
MVKMTDKYTIEKEEGIFGVSFTLKKGDEVYGMIKGVDEKIAESHIEPLANYFYNVIIFIMREKKMQLLRKNK